MSGHSKWSKVKHQKEATDATKGRIFTKMASAIIIAVKEGGGTADPSSNFRLRLAIEKAKAANMPKENIERAIEKGVGHGEGANLEKVVYEAFGPGKAGIIIEATTDNHQRTTSMIKNVLDKGGGVLTAQGAVSYLFTYLGLIEAGKNGKSYDDMMNFTIEAGGEDIAEEDGGYDIYTNPMDLHKVKEELEQKNISIKNAELIYKPNMQVNVSPEEGSKLKNLIANLEDLEDVQKVYTNVTM